MTKLFSTNYFSMPIRLFPAASGSPAADVLPAALLLRHPEIELWFSEHARHEADGTLIVAKQQLADLTVFCTETLASRYGAPQFYDCSGGVCRPLDPADPDGAALSDTARQLTALLWNEADEFRVEITG